MKERLLACALRMLEEDGIGSLSLRAIAKQAGVSHGAPLRHFPSRAALLSAVAVAGYRKNVEEREKALAATGPSAAERLHAAARSYVDFAIANPGLYQLMSRPDLLLPTDPELSRASRPFYEHGVELVAARQTEQPGWKSGVDSRLLAAALWAALHGFVQLWLLGALTRVSHTSSLPAALDVALAAFDLNP